MDQEARNHIINYLKNDLRYDGRKTTDFRKIEVETGVVQTAEGSSRVKIGDTEVYVGIKFEVGKPYPDIPDQGTMMVNAELIPMSSSRFESGPPSIQAIELSRVVDRGIRESGAIDTKKLCIKEGELVWTVIIDIVPINDAGNMFDVSSLAVLLALLDARFPKLNGEKIDFKSKTKDKLPMKEKPISVTILKISNNFIVDPLTAEEDVLDARLTVASLENGTICALQKGGDQPLSEKDIEKMVDLALEKAKELRKYIR